MPGQIVNISWKAAVSETALKCGDPFFKDFPKNIYSQAVFRAERSIAKQYGFMDRQLTLTTENDSGEIDIGPLNFSGAWKVTISKPATDENSSPEVLNYSRIQHEGITDTESVTLSDYRYSINYIGNRYVLRYNGASAGDEINIYYVSSIAGEEDYEYYDGEGNANLIPILPNNYYEETVRRAVIYIAELGVANFDSMKAKRYFALLRIHGRQSDRADDKTLDRDRPWIMIKLFSTQFPGD